MTNFATECMEEERETGFVVDDDKKADWCIRKIQELEADTAEYTKDEPVIIEWARQNAPELVEDVPKLKWTDLKKLGKTDGELLVIPETGEVVPGVKVVERGRTFVVEK